MSAGMQHDVDVLVVGAGPVGLTLINLLADAGVRTLLVDRAGDVSDEPRAISITDETLRVMQDIGIMDRLAPEMLMDTGARYFGRKGQLLAEVRARQPRLGQPAKSQFDQPVLAQLLRDAARARAQAHVCFNTEATQIRMDPEGVTVDLKGPEGTRTLRSRWLVACDGGRSTIRTQLGIALEGSTQVQRWIVIDVLNGRGEPEPFSQFHCNGRRPCVVVPGVKGRCRYEFMLLAQDDPQTILQPDAVVRLVAPYQAIEPRDIRRAAVYVAQQRIATTFRQGRVLLAGDAAHLMPPFAGQGLNAGVRDAANLAWKLAAAVRGQATDALLDTYEQERRPHAADMVRLSYRIGKVVMSTHPVATAMRDWALTALGLVPAAKAWIVGMKFLRQPHFVEGCVREPAPHLQPAVASLVGKALAQPRVRTAKGETVWLDRLLGAGWALLEFRPDGGLQVTREAQAGHRETPVAVEDLDGLFTQAAGSGAVLLVRPDRYVAAAVAGRDELPQLLRSFDTLLPGLGSSFERREAQTPNATLSRSALA
ncbi:bifunctional 3-(3-hydroxy-phenyl)propionate/3-hydroxycinnamic acid hydroxylase [Pseudacidovorax sp. NFM-22]|uniref:bifunctional 3-(3-hydroxy-phenyl)propionate/3-hydroxycinnamic acid hydroxylase n=1 Tax=Pseudacidovorax sp. NFM-22 TaxID=2744469 RepID=UPI001F29E506|nr:bifunctional 3-(3-hydroxy-phenyl)propionate/3-hydroxycinnamic acid hydroxylase [Pseudacidovorax sp. NFM-22]